MMTSGPRCPNCEQVFIDYRAHRDYCPAKRRDDEPILLNYGYGYRAFTVSDALAWAERRAAEVLG